MGILWDELSNTQLIIGISIVLLILNWGIKRLLKNRLRYRNLKSHEWAAFECIRSGDYPKLVLLMEINKINVNL
jgi:hypothetical protein